MCKENRNKSDECIFPELNIPLCCVRICPLDGVDVTGLLGPGEEHLGHPGWGGGHGAITALLVHAGDQVTQLLSSVVTNYSKSKDQIVVYGIHIDKPKSKSQVQAQSQIEKGKRNLDSGLSLNSYGNLESYPLHNQIHGLVPIELFALV